MEWRPFPHALSQGSFNFKLSAAQSVAPTGVYTGCSMEEKLIEAVHSFPCLWQVSSSSYKDTGARQNAWGHVASQVGMISAQECTKRWKTLRDRFVRELKKVKNNNSDISYTSSWALFDLLLFLQDSIRHRTANKRTQESEAYLEQSDLQSANSPTIPSESLSSVASYSSQEPKAKKRKTKMDNATLKTLHERQQRSLDEEELFGSHIAAILRRFSKKQKAIAKLRIQEVLVDVEFPDASISLHYSTP